eukprot:c40550_g1_i1.p3 GENE.c40550_g1_i1~~c40550_g1_i1.p3  ORF type:complete len:125 (+),score=0.37 c40550_g1_i1:142-516(+)
MLASGVTAARPTPLLGFGTLARTALTMTFAKTVRPISLLSTTRRMSSSRCEFPAPGLELPQHRFRPNGSALLVPMPTWEAASARCARQRVPVLLLLRLVLRPSVAAALRLSGPLSSDLWAVPSP